MSAHAREKKQLVTRVYSHRTVPIHIELMNYVDYKLSSVVSLLYTEGGVILRVAIKVFPA